MGARSTRPKAAQPDGGPSDTPWRRLVNGALYDLEKYPDFMENLDVCALGEERKYGSGEWEFQGVTHKPYWPMGIREQIPYEKMRDTERTKLPKRVIVKNVLASGSENKWQDKHGVEWTLWLNGNWRGLTYFINSCMAENLEWARYDGDLVAMMRPEENFPVSKATCFWKGRFWIMLPPNASKEGSKYLVYEDEAGIENQLVGNNETDILWSNMVQWRLKDSTGDGTWNNYEYPRRRDVDGNKIVTPDTLKNVDRLWSQEDVRKSCSQGGIVTSVTPPDHAYEYRYIREFPSCVTLNIDGETNCYEPSDKKFGKFQLNGLYFHRLCQEMSKASGTSLSIPGRYGLPKTRGGQLVSVDTELSEATCNQGASTTESEQGHTPDSSDGDRPKDI